MNRALLAPPATSRRRMLAGATGILAASAIGSSLPDVGLAAPSRASQGRGEGTVKTSDGARIFYKDWGTGPAVLLSHGWPLNADAWEDQLFFLASNGCRVIAHDRRGHGRSTQTWGGNTIDGYADDLATLMEALAS